MAHRVGLQRSGGRRSRHLIIGAALLASILAPTMALADEGGVSFWLPGFYGSLAAAPSAPGWAFVTLYYHTSASAGADVSAIARNSHVEPHISYRGTYL
jgi:hypothetical protein